VDQLTDAGDVAVHQGRALFQGLDGDEQMSLCLDSGIIVVLGENVVLIVEIVDILVEVRAWQRSFVRYGVVCRVMGVVVEVVGIVSVVKNLLC